mmetsp:Transcript_16168/g.35184  ORF Transcript_16168/g.35184 Transcript_16168/m.35184 type:complete len:88 (-) Transcript_16168:12-275(-)
MVRMYASQVYHDDRFYVCSFAFLSFYSSICSSIMGSDGTYLAVSWHSLPRSDWAEMHEIASSAASSNAIASGGTTSSSVGGPPPRVR